MKKFLKAALVMAKHSKCVSVGKGALIAGAGVALTYISNHLCDLQLGEHSALVAGLLMVCINGARKYLAKEEAAIAQS
jgi:hypothetical protein